MRHENALCEMGFGQQLFAQQRFKLKLRSNLLKMFNSLFALCGLALKNDYDFYFHRNWGEFHFHRKWGDFHQSYDVKNRLNSCDFSIGSD